MINFNKKDPVADIIRGIMEKELKGNQTKLDKNHNGKLDGQDFKILRGQKKATEEVEELDEISTKTLAGAAKAASDPDSDYYYGKSHDAQKFVDHAKKTKDAKSAAAVQGAADKSHYPRDNHTSGYDKLTYRTPPRVTAAGKANKQDVKTLKGKIQGRNEDVEPVEENAFDYKSPRQPEPNGGSGVKKGARYGGSKQKEKPEQEEPKEKMKEAIEDTLHPAGAALLKHIKPQHHNLYKPHLAKDTFNGSYKDRTDVLNAAKSAGHLKEQVLTLKVMKEKYEEPILDELINEVLSKDADAGDWIHDFVHSDNPKFEGKSTVERKKMALGAYYAKQDEEAVQEGYPVSPGWPAFKKKKAKEPVDAKDSKVQEGLKSVVKKTFKALTGGSDEDQRKDLQRKMGVPQTGKKPTKEEVEQLGEGGIGDLPNRGMLGTDTEGPHGVYHSSGTKLKIVSKHKTLDSALKHVDKLRKKSGKADHFYGHLSLHGPDQGKIPSQFHEEVVTEGRSPVSSQGMDTPFVTNAENKPLNNAKELAAKTMKRMKNEMLGKTGTSE